MKYRKEFVTNSSSSSFVCEVCGCAEAGYDSSPGELGFSLCENGHYVCQTHVQVTADQLRAAVQQYSEDIDRDYAITMAGRCEDVIAEAGSALIDGEAIERINFDELPGELCPVCTMVSIPSNILLRYAIHHYGTTRAELLEALRDEFGDFNDLKRGLLDVK